MDADEVSQAPSQPVASLVDIHQPSAPAAASAAPPDQTPPLPPPSSTSSTSTTSPSPDPLSRTQASQQQPSASVPPPLQSWPHGISSIRPQPFSHPPLPSSSTAPSSSSSSSLSSSTAPSSVARGGMVLGVPAHHTRSHSPGQPYFGSPSPAFSQTFGGLPRPEPSPLQVRQHPQGVQTIGMIGSMSPGSQLRPIGASGQYQQRLGPPTPRAGSLSTNQTSSAQRFQSHGLPRTPSIAASTSSPTIQSLQTLQQQWASAQAKLENASPSPSTSYRPQAKQQNSQQRNNLSQQSQQQPTQASTQQPPTAQQQQPQNIQQQQTGFSIQLLENQVTDPESTTRILTKKSIRELVAQVDPSEKLDPDVEDVLMDIADDFIESVTTFACSLAKHRKSSTLETKDILLHVERNWNMTLPGFGGEEIKIYKKQLTADIHKERLSAIRKSMAVGTSEIGASRNPASGQASGSSRTHASKLPPFGSPRV